MDDTPRAPALSTEDAHDSRGGGKVAEGELGPARPDKTRDVYTQSRGGGKVAEGELGPARPDKTRDVYTQYRELKRKVPLEETYTNDLLPAKQ